ncbi:MAG: creatininase family protein [Candidatus Viridilinea halotolerans]|uniref:Creatininase family protein n=1 Tax=Candidatus Viridilinea halotolerans TaxID=2491704 RepID=A0A426U1Y5_9CHLR|nr:MAG: creatininase family protein [Candidatus Viridilinea halotolerans]
MKSLPTWGRYAELRPHELAHIRGETPVVYLPWGGLTWHGPHLPLGMDGLIAEVVAERAARRTGGVLLPLVAWPVEGVPHEDTLSLSTATVRTILYETFTALARNGWVAVVLVSGHYSQAHDLLLIEAALEAIRDLGLLVLAIPPLALVDEEMLDHGALWETSTLLALRPELVDLDALGQGPLNPAASGVVGRDPRHTASSSLGVTALNLAVERIIIAVNDLLDQGDPAPLIALYGNRRERFQAFIVRYGSDPESSARAWWAEVTRSQPSDE